MDKALNTAKKIGSIRLKRNLFDVIQTYVTSKVEGTNEEFIAELLSKIQEESKSSNMDEKSHLVQQAIFVNILGYDTTWADFMVLDVMSSDNYSSKRICYTAASQMWNSNSDVVLMATNRIHKDLTSTSSLVTSVVLTSISQFLSQSLAQHVANDIISLMSSSRANIRQKAISTFYYLCLQYPETLKSGFPVLKTRLDDSDSSVVFSTLSVLSELVQHNANLLLPLIPKLHKMLETTNSNWITLKLIFILRHLCPIEPRLSKKLIPPFTNLLETTSSVTVLFEAVRTIIEVPIINTVLLTYSTQRMQSFLEHQDPNLRFLCLSLFLKLMEIQPKLVAQHKEIITQCLDSNDEATRLLALDLLMALANEKTLDGIVSKMFDHFKEAISSQFKDTIITKVIQICSKDDYSLISDFDWYINVLGDFMEEGGFTCYDIISNQFLDLALRVPSTRPTLVTLMSHIIEMKSFRDATKLLLSSLYIISEYSENSNPLPSILRSSILFCDERVQVSCLSTAFKLYIKSQSSEEFELAESIIKENIKEFQTGIFAEVQDISVMLLQLIELLKSIEDQKDIEDLRTKLLEEYDEEKFPPLEIPDELNLPDTLFKGSDDEDFEEPEEIKSSKIDNLLEEATKESKKDKSSHHRKQTKKVDRSQVVIKSSKKSILPSNNNNNNQNKLDPLSKAFANIEIKEQSEPIPKPQPYSQSNISNKIENDKKPVLRKKQKRNNELIDEPIKKSNEPPVTSPLPNSRLQELFSNSIIKINATEFHCKNNQLTIDLEINNISNIEIPSISIELLNNDNIKSISLNPITKPILSKQKFAHQIILEFKNIIKPERIPLRFIPTSTISDVIETQIKIYPSFFLIPGEISTLNDSKESSNISFEFEFSYKCKPKELLQNLVNILRGPIIPQTEKTSKLIYSLNSNGFISLCLLSIENDEKANIILNSNNKEFADLLMKELKLKLKFLFK